jgi:hypothetical protein
MPPKKEEKKVDAVEEIAVILLTIIFIGSVVMRIKQILAANGESNFWTSFLAYFFGHIWPIVRLIGAIITAVSFVGIWHSFRGLTQVLKNEKAIYGPFPEEIISEDKYGVQHKNEQWERVVELSNSANSSDWRIAIIEADTMLEDFLQAEGYEGESVGDRLKAVDRGELLTLNNAWEAHKIRNDIAHGGVSYQLTERDAKRAVRLYESVFKEVELI